jgi:hypothetical protein
MARRRLTDTRFIAGALALETRIGYFFRERKEVMCSDRQYA